jgi:hypothetical protein
VKEILTRFIAGTPLEPADVIVLGGQLAAQYNANAKTHSLEHKQGWERLQAKAQ